MDENKLIKLKDVGYTVKKVCALCRYSLFAPHKLFGVCTAYEYTHQKHTGPDRRLSILKFGYCNDFKRDYTTNFGAWEEFFEESRKEGGEK